MNYILVNLKMDERTFFFLIFKWLVGCKTFCYIMNIMIDGTLVHVVLCFHAKNIII